MHVTVSSVTISSINNRVQSPLWKKHVGTNPKIDNYSLTQAKLNVRLFFTISVAMFLVLNKTKGK